jgi:GH35 family endo-1,4-beta-xylanase
MKYINKLLLGAVSVLFMASCVEDSLLDYRVDKPESVVQQEYLNDYDVLKSYVDRSASPDFKLGAGVSLNAFNERGVVYSHIMSNFDEVTAGYAMKHGAIVQNNGSMNFAGVKNFIATAQEAGVTIYGHTLAWHANQNAEYLNSTIAPTIIPGTAGPTWDPVTEIDFETDDASKYLGNAGAAMEFTADGGGKDGEGRALKITNSGGHANDWDSQFFVLIDPAAQEGEQYELTMDVKADVDFSIPTQAHSVPYAYSFYDFFGAIPASSEWITYTKQVTVSADMAKNGGAGAIAFNLGVNANVFYFDNISVKKYNESGGGGPVLEASVITNTDFENGDGGWGGWGGASTRSLSADGEGYGGSGFAYTFTNPSAGNFWEAQVAYDLAPLVEGSNYVLNFQVKATAAGAIRAEIQSSSDYSSDGFGSFDVSNEWTEYTLETVAGRDDRNRFIISFGDYVGTVYIDDVTLRRLNPDGGGEQIIEMTPEEKKDTITAELDRWIAGMMEVSKDYVHAWDVVNEPMDDGNPSELKTGIGNDNLPADHFYWQDYLGKDYAVMAFNLAAQYGSPEDKLFINDYNLEYNIDKCKGLIKYVEYIEEQGARVDGIGTQMHINTNSDKDKIVEMFNLLAATGKLIKISELDMGIADGVITADATEADLQAQADMYQFVVEKYLELIPASQQYGITVWSPLDSPKESSWRADQPIGLWNLNYYRKPAYAGFADGLSGN